MDTTLVLVFLSLCFAQFTYSVRVRSCRKPGSRNHNPVIQMKKLNIEPMPIVMPGDMTMSIDVTTRRAFNGADIEFKVYKYSSILGWIKLPCFFKLGSCLYKDTCTLLDRMIDGNWGLGILPNIAEGFKSMMETMNTTSECPVQESDINVEGITIKLPRIPSALTFLTTGDYKFKAKLTEKGTGEELGCFELGIISIKEARREDSSWWGRRKRRTIKNLYNKDMYI